MTVQQRVPETASARHLDVANRASIRRTNLGLVLRHLRARGSRSRTQLAEDLGLPKATISNLVNELVERNLVREGDVQRGGGVGRPRQAVELHGRMLCGLGVEISVDYARAIALDLRGETLLDQRITINAKRDSDVLLDAVAALLARAIDTMRAQGVEVVGVTVAAPGEIDRDAGVVLFAANMNWSRLPVVAGLTARLGPDAPPVTVGNDAKFGAVAEHAIAGPVGIHDLIYITGEVGVGAGIITDGQLLLGATGFAGEVGHMPLDPERQLCGCGRRGCWETMVGLAALMRHAADPDDPVRDPNRDLEVRLAEIRTRAAMGDGRTLAALDRIAHGLGLGIGLLVDVLNPQAVVLGGYFAILGDFLLETTRRVVDEHVMAPHAGGCTLLVSTLGFTSAARGAAQDALESVFHDPGAVSAPAS